jgi:hypothetical protein
MWYKKDCKQIEYIYKRKNILYYHKSNDYYSRIRNLLQER